MRRFEYIRPGTVAEASAVLRDNADEALAMAGGTAVVVLLDQGVLRPRYVVDLGAIPGLRGLDATPEGGLHVGALTPIRVLERDSMVRDHFGLLAEAASQVASVRIRNVATVGGSISYGEPQTDTPTALMALGASVTVAGLTGTRSVPLEEFYVGMYETVLEPGELVTGASIPPPRDGSAGCHLKFTLGSPENKPVANVSVALEVEPGTRRCSQVRIVMGAVGPVPVVATEAAALLEGERLEDGVVEEAARRAADQTDPVDDIRGSAWYKRRVIRVLVERGVRCALQRLTA